jgi:predicted NBD/HSP70 family sugar kinase
MIHFFGKAVACLINILDPDAIVIGGGVGNVDELYTRGVKEAEKYLFNPRLIKMHLTLYLKDV